jgi:hypothetical protein
VDKVDDVYKYGDMDKFLGDVDKLPSNVGKYSDMDVIACDILDCAIFRYRLNMCS